MIPMSRPSRRAVCAGLLAAAAPISAFGAEDLDARLRAIEAATGGRLGLSVEGEGIAPLSWRADERFPFCSTFKVLTAAAVLARVDAGAVQLDQPLPMREADIMSYAPVAKKAFAEGRNMTVAEACEAAVVWSDNTAANLQFALLGGPAELTRWVRGTGDAVTRFDRIEIDLNTAIPGDPRDTTSPAAMRETLSRVPPRNGAHA